MARNYRHLTLTERDTTMRMRDRRVSIGRVAAELNRHPATIYRELRRNFFYDEDAWFRGYFGRVAHQKAASRWVRGGKVACDRTLAPRIVAHLKQCGPPEQSAGRLRLDVVNHITVCNETIYLFNYWAEGRKLGL